MLLEDYSWTAQCMWDYAGVVVCVVWLCVVSFKVRLSGEGKVGCAGGCYFVVD